MKKINNNINQKVLDFELSLETNSACFSPSAIDKGTLIMLSAAEFKNEQRILDLGCGYGVVQIAAAKTAGENNVVMSDNNNDVLICARKILF